MKTMIKLLALLIAAFAFSGCAAAFTDVRANGDGTYTLTYTKAGFFRTYGEVYRCQVQAPTQMVCSNIDRL